MTEGMMIDPAVEDFSLTLKRGQGIWITVRDEDGDELVLRVGIDLPTGGLALRITDVGNEDGTPIDELLVNFS